MIPCFCSFDFGVKYEPGLFLTGFTPILSFIPSSYICGQQLPFNWLPLLVLLHHGNPLLIHTGPICEGSCAMCPSCGCRGLQRPMCAVSLSVDSDRPAFSHSSFTQRSWRTKRPELVATVRKSHLRMINDGEKCVSSFLRGSDSLVPRNRAYLLI